MSGKHYQLKDGLNSRTNRSQIKLNKTEKRSKCTSKLGSTPEKRFAASKRKASLTISNGRPNDSNPNLPKEENINVKKSKIYLEHENYFADDGKTKAIKQEESNSMVEKEFRKYNKIQWP
ncbi:unnamed protein product [Brachionus calyciflorus]|uniref:Uncharacterized protein n=1 Tax=Brachionus calyciflorus TaxID=104777 RepID=A0A814RXA1_9BILA|nr:unnamed protein product [Brachionus calyciflorus]